MILVIECVIACLIFGTGIIIAVLCNRAAWYSEYAPEVQAVFLEKNPEYKQSKTKKINIGFICLRLGYPDVLEKSTAAWYRRYG